MSDTGASQGGDESRSVFTLPNGNLLVPVEAEQPAGGCATGMQELEPGSAEHAEWRARRQGTAAPGPAA